MRISRPFYKLWNLACLAWFIRLVSNASCCIAFVNDYDYGEDDDFIYEIFSVSRGTINEIKKYRELFWLDFRLDSIFDLHSHAIWDLSEHWKIQNKATNNK